VRPGAEFPRRPVQARAAAGLLAIGLLLALPRSLRADDLLAEAVDADAAIEERVRLVLVHRLSADAGALAADVADLNARDDQRQDAGLPRTGLTDDVRYLAAGLAITRDARRESALSARDTDLKCEFVHSCTSLAHADLPDCRVFLT